MNIIYHKIYKESLSYTHPQGLSILRVCAISPYQCYLEHGGLAYTEYGLNNTLIR
jgi:hypothetical protein